MAWLITPCPAESRAFGYLREAIAIERRARRCAAHWAPHLQHSRAWLLQSAGAGGALGVVLGSGALLDVPLAELAARFERLYLVDMLHLPRVRRAVRAHAGVVLLERDVTGVVAPLARLACRRAPLAPAALAQIFAAHPDLHDLEAADWVASVNLFSQLPLLPLAAAARACPSATEADLLDWQDRLLSTHLAWLRQRRRGCLLADVCQRTLRPDGVVEVMDYAPWLAPWGPAAAVWDWCLADAAETGDGRRILHRVGAWCW